MRWASKRPVYNDMRVTKKFLFFSWIVWFHEKPKPKYDPQYIKGSKLGRGKMDKQDLMNWLDYMSELLGEQFADIMKYEAIYPKIIGGLIDKESVLTNEMNSAYKKLSKI